MCWSWRKGAQREVAAPLLQTGLRMGGALVRPALPNDGGAGLVAGGTRAAHHLHRSRGRARRAGCVAVSMRLRADSADEPVARRTALLAREAELRRDGDAGSIGLAQKGLRFALLVAQRSHPVVPGTEFVCAAMVAGETAGALRRRRPGRQKQAHVRTESRRCGDRGRTLTARALPRTAGSCDPRSIAKRKSRAWRRYFKAVDSASCSAQNHPDDRNCRRL